MKATAKLKTWAYRLFVTTALLAGLSMAVLVLGFGYVIGGRAFSVQAQTHSAGKNTVPRAYRDGKPLHERKPVVGEINGLSVSIPFEYLFHLPITYDGDPHFLERRQKPAPERTLDSKLASVSLLVQRPDMKPLTAENAQSYKNKTIYDDDWLVVHIQANSSFNPPHHIALRWQELGIESRSRQRAITGKPTNFVEQPELVHGLTYAVGEGLDYTRDDFSNRVFYYHREDGRIVTFIDCGAGPTAAPRGVHNCDHEFLLLPDACAKVSFQYGPDALSDWRDMEDKIRRLVMGFMVKRTAEPPVQCSGVVRQPPMGTGTTNTHKGHEKP